MPQDEHTTMTILAPLSNDAARLYGARSTSLKTLLQLAGLAVSEHAERQKLNISSYSPASELARAMGAAADLLRALGVPQQTIDRAVAGKPRQ